MTRDEAEMLMDYWNCLHESGHAIVAHHNDVLVFTEVGDDVHGDLGTTRRTWLPDWQTLTCQLAGAGAEVRARGITWTFAFSSAASGDWENAQVTIDRIVRSTGATRRSVVADAKKNVLAFLGMHWYELLAIAHTLQDERHLDAGAVAEVVRRAELL